jgi:hypothetical protein
MARNILILVRAGDAIHTLNPSTRDVHLLDGRYFFRDGWSYRKLFGLDFIRGLKAPSLDTPLVSHRRFNLLLHVRDLLVTLETQKDLIAFDYSISFGDDKSRRHGGGMGGFRLEGGYGSISTTPKGYCDMTISNEGPNGRGREIAIIDMRVRGEINTDKGMLRVHRRKAAVGWFDELDQLIAFLERQSADSVEILHTLGD